MAVYAILAAAIWAEGALSIWAVGISRRRTTGAPGLGLLLAHHHAVLEPDAHAPELRAPERAALLDRLGLDRASACAIASPSRRAARS